MWHRSNCVKIGNINLSLKLNDLATWLRITLAFLADSAYWLHDWMVSWIDASTLQYIFLPPLFSALILPCIVCVLGFVHPICITLHFSMLNFMLILQHMPLGYQDTLDWRICLSWSVRTVWPSLLSSANLSQIFMSSATKSIYLMNIINASGPITEPCGTEPERTSFQSGCSPFMTALCFVRRASA